MNEPTQESEARRSRRRRSSAAVAAVLVVLATLVVARDTHSAVDPRKPNIIFILTDDQSIKTLQQMTNVKELAASGTTFSRAFVSNPLCCPSRSTILTGLFSGHSGVWSNGDQEGSPSGGYTGFTVNGNEQRSLAYHLSTDLNYRTGLFGKYLNFYVAAPGAPGPPVVAGWTDFHAFVGRNGSYYGYDLTDGTTNPDGTYHTVHHGTAPRDYSTNVLANLAVQFLKEQTDSQPFFLFYTPFAPHTPRIPARRDADVTASTAFSTPAFNEADVSDKPAYMQELPLLNETRLQADYDDQYGALASVDRAVGRFEAALSPEELANTIFIYMSDNGWLWGDHRLKAKVAPYERSIHVPLIVRMPGQTTPAKVNTLVMNADLTPTIFELLSITPDDPVYGSHLDGQSLLPLLTGIGTFAPRPSILLEQLAGGRIDRAPSYCGLRTATWKYIAYSGGFEELYNLTKDRNEMSNRASAKPGVITNMRTKTEALCDPLPPDFPSDFWASLS